MRTPLSFTASEQEVTWSGKDARFSFTQSCALRWLASAECEEMRRELENAEQRVAARSSLSGVFLLPRKRNLPPGPAAFEDPKRKQTLQNVRLARYVAMRRIQQHMKLG